MEWSLIGDLDTRKYPLKGRDAENQMKPEGHVNYKMDIVVIQDQM